MCQGEEFGLFSSTAGGRRRILNGRIFKSDLFHPLGEQMLEGQEWPVEQTSKEANVAQMENDGNWEEAGRSRGGEKRAGKSPFWQQR